MASKQESKQGQIANGSMAKRVKSVMDDDGLLGFHGETWTTHPDLIC